MRHLPTSQYCGLTVVLSQPSRQDVTELLSGYAGGTVFNDECLGPTTNRYACDIRTADTIEAGLLPNTKGLLLLGDRSFHDWTNSSYRDYTLNEQRGTPLETRWNIPTIATYSPQDAVDIQNYEAKYNRHLNADANSDGDEGDSDASEYSEKKRHGKTSRSNYRHWLRRDTKKILYAIQNGTRRTSDDFDTRIFPRASEVIAALNAITEDDYLYFDIETDSNWNITCFGFNSSSSRIVYSVPILRYDYSLGYSLETYWILRALVLATQRAKAVVIHNSMFDCFVLAWKYKILPPACIYDTMIAQHRIFPEAEKSLGHSISSWPEIWEPFHKDEGVFMPWNVIQEKQLLTYNAKDVIGMRLVHEAQMRFVSSDSAPGGLAASIEQGNKAIRPFLMMQLQGMAFDDTLRQSKLKYNDELLTQYLRAIRLLVGPSIDLLPSSSRSCVKYFHDALGYPVVGRSKKTQAPSLDETNLLKLKLKNPDNIVIDFSIKYRQLVKESGTLGFEPWIN